ncbi:RE2 [Symbiodinium necroappetens]|uniref:RE2 protein n=1 Tax=Symbiodinium necroappetens TaxID=1628268 RepID=A0A813CF71_9DINO|nr:RE2 [Symbiodinium necroappetens]
MERGDDSACASWDGSQHSWNDYVRKVRLQWARTPEKRKGLLGAELVSRLSGKAWDVTRELDFSRLQDRDGAAYLLEVLEQRLGRTPVPDLGVRLEQLFMRTRRSPGQSMSQWSAELRDAYRNLQRAMARARAGSPTKNGSPKAGGSSSPAKLSSTALRRRSWTTAEPEPGFGLDEDDRREDVDDTGEHPDHELPVADERRTGAHSREAGDAAAEPTRAWTAEEWEAWYSGWNGRRRGRWENTSDGGATQAQTPLPEPKWERFALEEVEVLPPEILGWLLLRRANLSSASRLAILSVTGNKLEFDLVEKALRDQEEDLLASERQRDPRAARHRRSYWVEDQGEWGLLAEDAFDEAHEGGDASLDIHWVGNRLPAEVYPVEEIDEEWTSYGHDGAEIHWVWYDNEWQTQDAEGAWWTWSDSKPWMEIDECMAVDPQAGKELADTFATFQDKVRTFRESRNLMKAAQTSRGFFPMKGSKGSKKGRSKGKGFGRPKGKGASALALQGDRGSSSSASGQRPGQPECTGCFICGSKDHEFKNCPKRKLPGKSGGPGGKSYFLEDISLEEVSEGEIRDNHTAMEEHNLEVPVYEPAIQFDELNDDSKTVLKVELRDNHTPVEEHNLEVPFYVPDAVYMVSPIEAPSDGERESTPHPDGALLCNTEILYEVPYPEATFTVNALESMWATSGQMYPGYAVVDSGATESVGSLEAIQAVMCRRRELYGVETVRICPNPHKTFRFGDGEQLSAMSYVELPQKLHQREISFSVYSLDVPRVPILMSIRTLKKLGAIVDFGERTVCFCKIDRTIVIPLTETRSGHLLIDLTKDWLNAAGNRDSCKDRLPFASTSSHSGEQYMSVEGERCEGDQCLPSTCVPEHDMSDKSAVPSVYDLSSPELDRPVEFMAQRRPSAQTPTMSTPQERSAAASSATVEKKKGQKEKAKIPEEERYDFSRQEGPDPRDGRTAGAPCYGEHQIMKPGRGSLSGSNAHGWWRVCEKCRLRLAYAPAWGAHGHFRQAGPLNADVKKVVMEVAEKEKAGETVDRDVLNAKNVALDGAEKSLIDKLSKVRAEKEKNLAKSKGAQAKSKAAPPSVTTTSSEAPATPSMVDLTRDQAMNVTPGRKKQRENEMTAEEQEYQGMSDELMIQREKEEIEDIADRLILEERYEDDECLEFIELMLEANQENSTRGILNDEDKNEYLCFGLYAFGNHYGVTNRTHRLGKAVRYLNNFLLRRMPDHRWTSLVISNNNLLPMRKDNHNIGWHALYGLGNYSGGGLWQEIVSENDSGGRAVHWRSDGNGVLRPGVIHESRGTPVYFPPKVNHATEPWKGNRILITAWTSRGIQACEPKNRRLLRRLLFPVPMKSEIQCFTSTCSCECILAEEDEDGMITVERETPEDVQESLEEILLAAQEELRTQITELPQVRKYDLDLLCLGGQKPSYLSEWIVANAGSSFAEQVLATCASRWLEIELPFFQDETEGENVRSSEAQADTLAWKDPQVKDCFHLLMKYHMIDKDVGTLEIKQVWEHVNFRGHKKAEEQWNRIGQDILDQTETALAVESTLPVESFSAEERKKYQKIVHQLHKRAGHPSNHTLAGMLRARGIHKEVVKMALDLQCADCQEMRLADSAPAVSLHQSDTPWKVIQVDNAELKVGNQVTHFMLIADEATHLIVAAYLYTRENTEGRNATAEEAVKAIEQHWVQMFGLPATLRLDPEGCFRSKFLEEWASERGVEVLPSPGEAHQQTGLVESLIGKVKKDAITLMAGDAMDPFRAILNVVAAHNTVHRTKGFSPAQWAFGRDFGSDGRLFDSEHGLPCVQAKVYNDTTFGESLNIREAAAAVYRKSQADHQMSRLMNMKTRPSRQYLPGDLVYYRRVKPPADNPAHPALGAPKINGGRWYGPGRVVATETRSDCYGLERRPMKVVWISSAGRLKRCAPDQLRHASEREAILAEEATEKVTPGWTFHSLLRGLDKGNFEIFDDYVFPENSEVKVHRRSHRSRTPARGDQRAPQVVPQNEGEAPTSSTSSQIPRTPGRTGEAPTSATSSQIPRTPGRTGEASGVKRHVSLDRYLTDPGYNPDLFQQAMRRPEGPGSGEAAGELQDNTAFKKARQQHELLDRPLHVIQQERPGGDASHPEAGFHLEGHGLVSDDELLVCKFEIKLPERANQWKKFNRDATSWVVNDLRKNEVKYARLNPEEKKQFDAAKTSEINQWIKEKAVKRATAEIPRGRVMRMRWVLTWKSDPQPENPDHHKAKARLVVVGFEDPDLTEVSRASPTMTRRTRQLLYVLARLRGWRTMKADVKAAFLQGEGSQQQREIFAMPPCELSQAMNIPPGEAIQLVKAAYGLVNAPAEWYKSVHATLSRLGFQRLRTEPCCWRLTRYVAGKPVLLGVVVAHVDDFILAGNENDEMWLQAVRDFHSTYRWSPWECRDYPHCGVQIHEGEQETVMSQADYCAQLKQIEVSNRDEDLPATEEEKSQLRGLLGGIQWRAYSTAPQHLATLSMLQTQANAATVKTLKAANKLCREVYHHRHETIRIQDLGVQPEDVVFLTWCDAAVGNRPDLKSTGGHLVCASVPAILEGESAPVIPISWKSGKLQRVSRSSLAAETQACSEAEEELMYVRVQWWEMLGYDIDLRRPEQACSKVTGALITDAKSLYDVLMKGDLNSAAAGLKEKYSALEALSLIERIHASKTKIRWVHSDAQVADALTKPSPSGALHALLTLGRWKLIYDPSFTSAKKRRQEFNFRQ